jgi:transcriptional regulator with XRE-family HTH domain
MKKLDILRENLKREMKKNNYSMAALSREIGYGETYVKDLFNDKVNNPSIFHIKKIADVLNVSLDNLVCDQEEIHQKDELLIKVSSKIFRIASDEYTPDKLGALVSLLYNHYLKFPDDFNEENFGEKISTLLKKESRM